MKRQMPPMPFENKTVQRFPLADTGRVEIKADNGAIFVEGWSRPEVVLEIAVRADEAIKLRQVTPEITAETQGFRLVVKESYYPTKYDWRRGGPGVTFWPAFTTITLRLPKTTVLKLQSSNASLDLAGLQGEVNATTFNGKLLYTLPRRADQRIEAHTYNGKLILPEPLFMWARGDEGQRRRRAEARLGAGTTRVLLDSYNGTVEVK